ncbi:MAG: hypothetical protein CME06_13015 [Gemmatimonadetes bacterium]|nr:hypothetical protein [Gemmatimonadota bacterium]
MASQNNLYKIQGRRTLDGETEERVFLFRDFSAKVFMKRLRQRFPDWKFDGEPQLAEPTPPQTEPSRIDTL